MSYIKICQIADHNPNVLDSEGVFYIETVDGAVLKNSVTEFPVQVSVEVIEFNDEAQFNIKGKAISFNVEIVTIPNLSLPIRQSVYNQLVGKYPSLVM